MLLQVEAEANTDSRPLPGFVPRKGAGLPLFGKSSTYPPPGPVSGAMIDIIGAGCLFETNMFCCCKAAAKP